MRRGSVYKSVIFHVAVAVACMVSFPWLRKEYNVPPPIMIEFAEVGKITQTDKVAPAKPKEDKKEDKKPPPAPKNTASEAKKPAPKEQVKDEKEKLVEKKDDLADERLAPDKKKQDKKKEEKKPKPETQKDFSSVLKNLANVKDDSESDSKDLKPDEKSSASGANAPLGEKLTISEEDALRRQLEGCWNVPIGAKDAENMAVEVYMIVRPDRTVQHAEIVDRARYGSDPFFRAAADAAIRAVKNNPNCAVLDLPPDKYDTWKTTTVVFNPKDMF